MHMYLKNTQLKNLVSLQMLIEPTEIFDVMDFICLFFHILEAKIDIHIEHFHETQPSFHGERDARARVFFPRLFDLGDEEFANFKVQNVSLWSVFKQ